MGVALDSKALVEKYPLTFLAIGAAAALAAPVVMVAMSGALRPTAKRILFGVLAVRREALRVAAESGEAYADLVAEVESEAQGEREVAPAPRAAARAPAPRAHARGSDDAAPPDA